MKKLVIFGAGGFGREVLQLVRDVNREAPAWECAGFLVDDGPQAETLVQGLPVLGGVDWLRCNPDVEVVVAVGEPAARKKIVERLVSVGAVFATLIHPRAWLGEYVSVGRGCVICAGALITTDIRLGEHVHVNIGTTIGHDSLLSDFVTVSPGVNVSGKVRLGDGVFLGSGAVLLPGVSVGEGAVIGANSVVLADLPPGCTAVGVPAKVVKSGIAS